MGLPYRLERDGLRYGLFVPAERAEEVRRQLVLYDRESQRFPPGGQSPVPPSLASGPARFIGLGGYAAVLLVGFACQLAFGRPLERAGMLDAQAFVEGRQYWRAFTALLLHGDLPHLAGNLLSGLCFGWVAQERFGVLKGWTLIALAGFLGNACNALAYYPEPHRSLGASTAVFGALGLMVGAAVRAGWSPQGMRALKHRLVPLAAGLLLLGWLGGGGPNPDGGNTDVLAHIWGFTAGGLLGAGAGRVKEAGGEAGAS
jgi:membrane associated rhomboid family serine protease